MEKMNLHIETIPQKPKPKVWDCESSLYDSFELKSFERQLDSAISSARSLSMPHLSDCRRTPPPPQPPAALTLTSKKSSKISRSLHKLVRSFFRPKQNHWKSLFRVHDQRSQDGAVYVYDRYGALTTIPEGPESVFVDNYDAAISPEIRSAALTGRSASDRFTAASVGISCA